MTLRGAGAYAHILNFSNSGDRGQDPHGDSVGCPMGSAATKPELSRIAPTENHDNDDGFIRIAESLPKAPGSRLHLSIQGRSVSVVRSMSDPSILYCLDSICYHAGGPLALGDIEEIPVYSESGVTRLECLICPWHHYKISLNNGEGFYQDLDRRWTSKGHRQRVHDARETSDGSVYIRLRLDSPEKLPSDDYAANQLWGASR